MPSRICASVGLGFLSSSALAVMICPFWQKPHCGHLLLDPRLLERMQVAVRREPFERRDLASDGARPA